MFEIVMFAYTAMELARLRETLRRWAMQVFVDAGAFRDLG